MTEPVCGICGTRARPPFRAPQPEIAPDLDMRPGEPIRSTLRDWIQTCRKCRAAAPDLSKLPESAGAVIASPAYRELTANGSEDTLPFRRWAMICERAGNRAEQAEALLQAAWAADDSAVATEAAELRARVAALWDGTADLEIALRRLDVLRRGGQFDAAAALAETLTIRGLDEVGSAILSFQKTRIAQRDVGRHLISATLPPPAHRPHVTHNQRAETGFWSRILRRGRK